ncbi:MAG: type II toxin-antitoxin system Phd/YefM family antitoxin [Kiritimatiellae bacterium]|nr:type II toxin-antitoxin system Phd/YefM family antitoxin [Kiritimatiellia bacterium]
MRPKTVSVTEAVRHFSDYLNRVAYRHETFLLARGRKAMAELRPVPVGRRLGDLPALLASLPRLSPREAGAFATDLTRARVSLKGERLKDPWAS